MDELTQELVKKICSWGDLRHVGESVCLRLVQDDMTPLRKRMTSADVKHNGVVRAGDLQFHSTSTARFSMPRLMVFPFPQTVRFDPGDIRAMVLLFRSILLKTEPGTVEFSIIDPQGLGEEFADYRELISLDKPVTAKAILTDEKEIESELCALREELAARLQGDHAKLPYKVVLFPGFPLGLSERSRSYKAFLQLIDKGPTCGILPLVSWCGPNAGLQEAFAQAAFDEILAKSIPYTSVGIEEIRRFLKKFEVGYTPQAMVTTPEKRAAVLQKVTDAFREMSRKTSPLQSLWNKDILWSENAADGLSATVGWDDYGMPICTTLGAPTSQHHMLVGGKTGCGKSNFLHVFIQSLCHRYSPEELELYLIDLKPGSTEFSAYSVSDQDRLIHARAVSKNDDVAWAESVLAYLEDQMRERAILFKTANVSDYRSYRKSTGKKLPRSLVVVDEFQCLFSAISNGEHNAEKTLNALLRQGRSAGIHVVLATQALQGLETREITQLISQCGIRIALPCSEEVSVRLLGTANVGASKLPGIPYAVLNDCDGQSSSNKVFRVPEMPPKNDEHWNHFRSEFLSEAKKRGIAYGDVENTLPEDGEGSLLPSEAELAEALFSGDGKVSASCEFVLGRVDRYGKDYFVTDLNCANLLVAGFDPSIRDGIIRAITTCIKMSKFDGYVESLVWYGKDVSELETFFNNVLPGNAEIGSFGRKVLIVVADKEEELFAPLPSVRPTGGLFAKAQPAQEVQSVKKTASQIFREVLKSQSMQIVLLVRNWKRLQSPATKDIFQEFEARIGFGLDEQDTASCLKFGGIAKTSERIPTGKAMWVNRVTGNSCVFVPFRSPAESEE